jgi:uncharacterized protein YfdQ (DUF2303 family)
MIVLGYRSGTNFIEVGRVLSKHTNMDAQKVKRIVSDIKEGKGVNLPDDFVLREDLEELNLFLG